MSNNKDWYSEGFNRLMSEASESLGVPVETIEEVYRFFSGLGLAGDYDVEKEVIWDLYYDED